MSDAKDDTTEADVADVIDQVEPEGSRPVGEALEEEASAPFVDRREDDRLREDAAEASGGGA